MKAAALNLPLRQSREISFVWSADVFSVLRALVSVSLGLLLLIHFPCWAAPSVLTASNIRFLFEILQNMFSCALQHLNTTLKLLHRDATSLQNKSPRSSQRCVGERSKAAQGTRTFCELWCFIETKGSGAVYFFLDTPTVRPRRPVVLVCWPRTRRLQGERQTRLGRL